SPKIRQKYGIGKSPKIRLPPLATIQLDAKVDGSVADSPTAHRDGSPHLRQRCFSIQPDLRQWYVSAANGIFRETTAHRDGSPMDTQKPSSSGCPATI